MSFEKEIESRKKIGRGARAALLCCGLAAVAWGAVPAGMVAQDTGAPPAEAAGTWTGHDMLAQKQRLLERLLGDLQRRAIRHGRGIPADLEQARELLRRAQEAFATEQLQTAEELTAAAFALATRLARGSAGREAGGAALRSRYRKMSETVTQFRVALLDAARAKNLDATNLGIGDVDALVEEAAIRAAGGDFARANIALDSAYRIVAESIAAVRSNETVVQRLVFDSPAEELRYEQDRYRSHELLVNMVLRERELDGATVRRVRADLESAARLHLAAEDHGNREDFERAIKAEEAAVDHLINALGKAGLYVPK